MYKGSYDEQQNLIVESIYWDAIGTILEDNGLTLQEKLDVLTITLSDFEEEEYYEECDGINRVLEFCKGKTEEQVLKDIMNLE